MSDLAKNVDRLLDLADAVCDETASENELAEMNSLLRADQQLRSRYLDYCWMNVAMKLELRAQRAVIDVRKQISSNSIAAVSNDHDGMKRDAPLHHAPAILAGALPRTVGYFSSGWPVAYLVATVIVGVGLVIGATSHVSQPATLVKNSPPVAVEHRPQSQSKAADFVGIITGMVDCKWANPQTAPATRTVRLRHKYALVAGLLEIAYETGAKVILEGPVSFEVESTNGGYLSAGKLTGKVETTKARGFSVRTPTATVTDLGTEFGVKVDHEGNSEVDVLQGAVRLQVQATAGGSAGELRLGVGRSVRVDAVKKTVTDCAADPTRFVRSLTHKASNVISVSFTHGRDADLDPRDQTGVLNAANWNNVDGSPIPAPMVKLHDAAGKPSGARLTWQWSGVKEPTYFNSDQMLDSRGRLFHGCFAGGTSVATLKISVTNVPYARYRVYVYYWSEPTQDPANLHTFGLSINGSKPTIISRPRTPLYHFSRYRDETESGNYQVFDGLSGSLSVVATPDGPAKHHELFICGMQIVDALGDE